MRRAALAAVAAAAVLAGCGADDDPPPAAASGRPTTAAVARGDLAATVALSGTLTYRAGADGRPYAAINRARGTYTALPAAGDAVACGDELYRVDDAPVLLLCGPVPAYRALQVGSVGRDVRQLNANLRRLGYGVRAGERRFTARTARALRALQRRRGAAATGTLALGDAVVLPRVGRVAAVRATLGGPARPGAAVVTATSRTLEVHVELDAAQQREVRVGDPARIALPGTAPVRGKVVRRGRVARAAEGDGGIATIPAPVALDRPAAARGLDRAPVQVEITTAGARDVLSVPVTALLGRAGGGYAVEVVRGGRRALAAVELGMFDTANGRVAVTGGVAEGDRVVVPSP